MKTKRYILMFYCINDYSEKQLSDELHFSLYFHFFAIKFFFSKSKLFFKHF